MWVMPLTIVAKFFRLFFIHSKLELPAQFAALNEEKIIIFKKNIRLQNIIIRLTKHLLQIFQQFVLNLFGPKFAWKTYTVLAA